MIKHIALTLTLAIGLAASAGAEMTLLEEAAEFEQLQIRVSVDGVGRVRISPCEECAPLKLSVKPSTRLRINGKVVPLRELNHGALRDGTLFYRKSDSRVLRIEATR